MKSRQLRLPYSIGLHPKVFFARPTRQQNGYSGQGLSRSVMREAIAVWSLVARLFKTNSSSVNNHPLYLELISIVSST